MKSLPLVIAVFLTLISHSAQSSLITTDNLVNPGLIDFSQFVGSGLNNVGPQQIGQLAGEDVVASGTPNNSSSIYLSGSWGHSSNGNWNSAAMDGFLGYNSGIGALVITFNDGPVSAVGAFTNYACCSQANGLITISALDVSMNVLETYTTSISTPGQSNAGQFLGISRAQEDIYHYQVHAWYPTIDNLVFARAVPAPGVVGLFVFGLLLLGRKLRASA